MASKVKKSATARNSNGLSKPVGVCFLLTVLCLGAVLSAGALIAVKSSNPYFIFGLFQYVVIAAVCLCLAFVMGKMLRKNGLLLGLAVGLGLFLLLCAISFAMGTFAFSKTFSVKLAVCVVCGMAGALFGVNKQEKRKRG